MSILCGHTCHSRIHPASTMHISVATYEAMVSSGANGDLQQCETPALPKETMVNTGMSWAFDPCGTAVLASKARKQDGPFYCHCGGKHPMHLKQRKFALKFTSRFSHNHKGKTGPKRSPCRGGGGESSDHALAKHMLKQHQGRYVFVLEKCPDCKQEVTEDCSSGVIRVEYKDEDLGWRYDCCLFREDIPVLALEVRHTHAVTDEKLKSVRSSGKELAEFLAHDILSLIHTPSQSESGPEKVPLTNLEIKYLRCPPCLVRKEAKDKEAREKAEEESRILREKQQAERQRAALEEAKRRAAALVAMQDAAKMPRANYKVTMSTTPQQFRSFVVLPTLARTTPVVGFDYTAPTTLHPSDPSKRTITDKDYFTLYPTGYPTGSHPGGLGCECGWCGGPTCKQRRLGGVSV